MVQWLDDEVVEAVMAWLIEMSSFLLGLYMYVLCIGSGVDADEMLCCAGGTSYCPSTRLSWLC